MNSKEILESYFLRKPPPLPEYSQRLEEEFSLIDKFGFTKVFQQVYEIIRIARSLHIPHIIRGSSGSSLVCFLMGITEIDPIHYKLELARFMNSGRTDLPDIDIDVPYNRRDELYEHIEKQWPKMVARISNHVTYGHKVALRESAKELFTQKISPIVELRSSKEKKLLRSLNSKRFSVEKVLPDKEDQEKVKEKAKEKTGTLKNYSKHCGGIVIFEEQGCVPEELRLETGKEDLLQQIHLNKDETEDAGYIKIDILSNRGLAQLVEAQREPKGLLDYPERDGPTERLLAKGENLGLTFGESRGMRKLFLGMKPRHMDDLAILLALIRPAAATQGRKREFLERWRYGAEETNPLSKQIIFDDDAICIIKEALRCDAAEADKWRKVFAKGNPAGRVQFRQRLYQKGISKSVQDYIMSELDYLVLYSFCKSHAVSYAQLVWALAYEKTHNPHRFWMAALNHCHSEYRKWVHYREAKLSGLELTREPPPYKVGMKQGKPALLSVKSQGEQLRLTQMFQQENSRQQDFNDMRDYGYWLSDTFLEGCGIWPESQQTLERWFGTTKEQKQIHVKFCGIIATGRVLRRDGLVTLLTIGVANGHYIDLVYPDIDAGTLLSYTGVEGKGLYEKKGGVETILVERIHGMSLQTLRTNAPLSSDKRS
jgi:DNA polymerase III alpha subunit